MDYQVSVVLKNGSHHSFRVTADEAASFDPSSAREWIGDAFSEAELEVPNPAGKLLLKDQILMLALEQKPADWAAPTEKLKKFLAATVVAMGRPAVSIDLANFKL